MSCQEPVAWAVMLSPDILHDRYTFEWEANAISEALWDKEKIQSEVVPLVPLNRSHTITNEERDAINVARIELNTLHCDECHHSHTLRNLLERLA